MSKTQQTALNKKYWDSQYWNILEEKYRKYLKENGKENSFDNGDIFVAKNVPSYEYKLYAVKDRRSLIIKLTKCSPPEWYD